MEACNDISFKYVDAVVDNIEMIKLQPPNGIFNVVGQIKWAGPIHQVGVGPNKAVLKSVCDGVLADSKSNISYAVQQFPVLSRPHFTFA